ncbi:hypothetical protein OAU52_00040 [bacterium]|nr:hypothetical protein [bacterium]
MNILKKYGLITITLTSLLGLSSCSDNTAGGETSNQLGITVYQSDGVTPAAGAKIKIFSSGDTSKLPIDIRETDENGQYKATDLALNSANPYHNMVIRYDSTEVLYKDSLFLTTENTNALTDDTLGLVGSIKGTVRMQPNHSTSTVLVHALGTDIYTKVDGKTSQFELKGLGAGDYNLMFTTSYEDYDIVLKEVTSENGKQTIISDTIVLPYLEVPIVRNLRGSFDTLTSTITLNWDSTNYSEFASYDIYVTTDPLKWSDQAIESVNTNLYSFTWAKIFESNRTNYYRVQMRNKSWQSGLPYGYVAVRMPPKSFVTTTFKHKIFHKASQQFVDSVSVNDSVSLHIELNNPNRKLVDLKVTGVDGFSNISTPTNQHKDSLAIFIDKDSTIILSATDDGGKIWLDTIFINVVEDKPTIISYDSTLTYRTLDTLHIVTEDLYGNVTNYEWDMDGDGVFEEQTTIPELAFTSDSILANKQFKIRLTDDDGNANIDSIIIDSDFFWTKTNLNIPSEIDSLSYITSSNSIVYLVDTAFNFWQSSDGMNSWTKNTNQTLASTEEYDINKISKIINFKGKIYAIKEFGTTTERTIQLWNNNSDDLSGDWSIIYEADSVYTMGAEVVLFTKNDSLYANFMNLTLQNNVYYPGPQHSSFDGFNWNQVNNSKHLGYVDELRIFFQHNNTTFDFIYGGMTNQVPFIREITEGKIIWNPSYTDVFNRQPLYDMTYSNANCYKQINFQGHHLFHFDYDLIFIDMDKLTAIDVGGGKERNHCTIVSSNEVYSISPDGIYKLGE